MEDRTGVEPSHVAAGIAWLAGGELNLDPRVEGARDLIVAVFRLAVADYLGLAFSHDGLGPVRRTRGAPYIEQAGLFLASAWAAYLAEVIGLNGSAIWREARQLGESHCDQVIRPAIAA